MKKLFVLLCLIPLLGGCGYTFVGHPAGYLFSSVQAPLAGGGPVGAKKGESCASSILGLIATGDASVDSAARNGGISQVGTVSYKYTSILGALYVQVCAVVTGN
jgi:hypothetical protein